MLRTVLIVSASAALAGCGATLIQSAGSNGSPYAPLDDGRRVGLVKYQIDDGDFFVRRRREDSYKKMYQSCGGPYFIVAEGPRAENGRVVTTVTETTSAVAAHVGGGASSSSASRPAPVHDTLTAASERKVETTKALVEEHWWYVQYRCAAPGETDGR
jgi:hypothetical protein